jgi:cytochrome c553
MFKRLTLLLVILTALLPFTPVNAAGDAEAGKAKSTVCGACHGMDGNSLIPNYPSLAGQVPGYVADQLQRFKSGERSSPEMIGQVVLLEEQDMADLDAYYASLAPRAATISADDEALALDGEKIYKGGFADRDIAACMSCHGPSGHGIPRRYPRVSAQQREYLKTQLLTFKKGDRTGYMDIMSDVAFSLSEDQIEALAVYMSGLD